MNDDDPGSSGDLEARYDVHDPESQELLTDEMLEAPVETLKPPVPVCVELSTTIAQAVRGMAERNHGCVLVIERGKLAGIFTERDLLRRVVGKVDMERTSVGEVMTRDPEAISITDSIAFAMNKMSVGGFRHVPLIDAQRRPVGVISVKDVIDYIAERFPRHIMNVPPDPTIRQPDLDAGGG